MKARLLWAARSPLRQHDTLFRTALTQLNALLAVCTASFALQVIEKGREREREAHTFTHPYLHACLPARPSSLCALKLKCTHLLSPRLCLPPPPTPPQNHHFHPHTTYQP